MLNKGELNGIKWLKNNIHKAKFYANVVPYTWMRVAMTLS